MKTNFEKELKIAHNLLRECIDYIESNCHVEQTTLAKSIVKDGRKLLTKPNGSYPYYNKYNYEKFTKKI